jgi:hypothetical protein
MMTEDKYIGYMLGICLISLEYRLQKYAFIGATIAFLQFKHFITSHKYQKRETTLKERCILLFRTLFFND